MKTIKDVLIYDNGGPDVKGGSIDRYTLVFPWDKNPRTGFVAMVGMSGSPFHPQGFCQHCEGKDGPHIGKRISYVDLNDDCAKVVRQELAAYNEAEVIAPQSANPVRYSVGQKVIVTHSTFERVWNASRNHCRGVSAISSEFVEKLRPYIGKTATVTHTFPPGYEMTISFDDGQAFHAKDSWVQAANLLASVTVFLADGTSYQTNVNAKVSDADISAYFVGTSFDRGVYPREHFVKCVKIEIDRT